MDFIIFLCFTLYAVVHADYFKAMSDNKLTLPANTDFSISPAFESGTLGFNLKASNFDDGTELYFGSYFTNGEDIFYRDTEGQLRNRRTNMYLCQKPNGKLGLYSNNPVPISTWKDAATGHYNIRQYSPTPNAGYPYAVNYTTNPVTLVPLTYDTNQSPKTALNFIFTSNKTFVNMTIHSPTITSGTYQVDSFFLNNTSPNDFQYTRSQKVTTSVTDTTTFEWSIDVKFGLTIAGGLAAEQGYFWNVNFNFELSAGMTSTTTRETMTQNEDMDQIVANITAYSCAVGVITLRHFKGIFPVTVYFADSHGVIDSAPATITVDKFTEAILTFKDCDSYSFEDNLPQGRNDTPHGRRY